MTKYLGLLQLSAEEASRMLDEGVAGRAAFFDIVVREAHGSVESFWFTDVGEWDVVCIVDMGPPIDGAPAPGAAATLARRAAGLTRREKWIALADPDDVSAAVGRLRSGEEAAVAPDG